MRSLNGFYSFALVALALICGLIYGNPATAASAATLNDAFTANGPEVSQTAPEQTVSPIVNRSYQATTAADDPAALNADYEIFMKNRTDNPFYSLATIERQTFLLPISQNIGVPCSCTMQGMTYRYVRLTKDSPPECVDTCGTLSASTSLPSVAGLLKRKPPAYKTFGESWRV